MPGAGPVRRRAWRSAGIATVRDLLMRLPRGYDDLGRVTPIARAGRASPTARWCWCAGRCARLHVFPRRLLDVFVEEDGAQRARALVPRPRGDGEVVREGERRSRWRARCGPRADGTRELVHPSNVTAALAAPAAPAAGLGLRPRYGLVEGVKGRTLETHRARRRWRRCAGRGEPELLPAGDAGAAGPAAARRRRCARCTRPATRRRRGRRARAGAAADRARGAARRAGGVPAAAARRRAGAARAVAAPAPAAALRAAGGGAARSR